MTFLEPYKLLHSLLVWKILCQRPFIRCCLKFHRSSFFIQMKLRERLFSENIFRFPPPAFLNHIAYRHR